ncbi:DUF4082 domain-containing protein [Micromonospora sp. NPDC047548]|uniref:DUF4082 domain-containing protein n=1 Tax=Micromonospora sp. NPDC047548 TaxID=3155624 RepID=UPI0033BFEE2A
MALTGLLLLGTGLVMSPANAATDACGTPDNVVVCENGKPGSPASEWDVVGAGDPELQGFATDISVNVGQQVDFKIKAAASSYTIDIYRLGWYGGDGARKWGSAVPSVPLPQQQPDCLEDAGTQIYDCGNWAVSASWTVPQSAVSGVYIARLQRPGAEDGSHIVFVVRDDSSQSRLFFQTSDTTWQAYNLYGGSNFYEGGARGRAYALSYNRPFATRGHMSGRDFLFSNEYPTIRFLERNGYDVSYTTGIDSDRRGGLIRNHKVFLSVGHDEYWSGAQRANVEAARDAGVHLAFFSGNEVYWKTRWESSQDGSGTPYRTLVCYKETWANDKIDDSAEWTGTWRDPRFTPPGDGGRPENALTGTAYVANDDDLPLQVPAEQGRFRIWRNTSVAAAAPGQVTTLAEHLVGYESNEDLDNGFRPAGLIRMSTTTGPTPQYLRDFGNKVSPGTTTHHITMYKASSGALVFSAGTIQWGWGLDDRHDSRTAVEPADPAIQQATINLLADMGVQPATLMTGRAAASASTDTQPPTATITSPTTGVSATNGNEVTVQGTASDTGGGRVAGVEVSTDGGETWHAAAGTTSWTYRFWASGLGTQSILARATDDSANLGQPSQPAVLTLTGSNTLFGQRLPANPAESDAGAWELGIRFTPLTDGFVTGIRFYKGPGNTGTHTGSLWSAGGTRLATGTFTGETATGWQKLSFSTAVPVTAHTRYVASYFAPAGHYAADFHQFNYRDWVSGPLAATRATQTSGNGLFRYGSSGFPASTYDGTNYYVDVTFTAAADAAPAVSSINPIGDQTGVPVSVAPSATFSKPIDASSLQFTLTNSAGAPVAGTVGYDGPTRTATFTPASPLEATRTYTAAVVGSDTQGNAMDAPTRWSFTTDLDPSVLKLFATNATPASPAYNDGGAVEVGVKFRPSVSGSVIGLRYFRGDGNIGTHTGSLWTASGTLLARLTFPSNAAIGWQSAMFANPVPISANTTYVVSYHAPNGHYAITTNFFASAWTNGPLTAPATANGVYRYSGTPAFPNNSYQAANYWVDPLILPGGGSEPPPAPTTIGFFAEDDLPAWDNWNDTSAVEVGVKFSSDVAGDVQGVRFYKGELNGGVHTGTLWSANGTLLATATFEDETASGWQMLKFSQPVTITAGTTYVISYQTLAGRYALTSNSFTNPLTRGPLHIPAAGAVYRYGGGFPGNPSNANYWVDVVFKRA